MEKGSSALVVTAQPAHSDSRLSPHGVRVDRELTRGARRVHEGLTWVTTVFRCAGKMPRAFIPAEHLLSHRLCVGTDASPLGHGCFPATLYDKNSSSN